LKAVILCGGLGTRLGNLTQNCPKPLLKFKNLSIIEWQIKSLKDVGVDEILINIHYLGDQIRDYLGDGKRYSIKIKYVFQKKLNGTAGGVNAFKNELIDEENFFVLYGDILTNECLNNLVLYNKKIKADCAIYVHKNKNSNSLLYFDNTSGLIVDLIERPSLEEKNIFVHNYNIKEFYSNSAIYLMNPNIFKYIPVDEEIDFPKHVFPELINNKKLYALEIKGQRYAVDTINQYKLAQKFFMS